MTKMFQHTLIVEEKGPGLHPITTQVFDWLRDISIEAGLLSVFISHTSASLLIQENADPDVCKDIEDFFDALVKRDPGLYRHSTEGPDDMPAHIRSALTQTSLTIPVKDGKPLLGVWQGIYLFEHRDRPQPRRIYLTFIGN